MGVTAGAPDVPVFMDLTATFDAAFSLLNEEAGSARLVGSCVGAFRGLCILIALGSLLGRGDAMGVFVLARPSPEDSCP